MALNLWPFGKTETRSQDYTDLVVGSLERGVSGLESNRLAAVELAAHCYGKAFASAQVQGSQALTPEALDGIGRSLIKRGEWVGLIQVDHAGIRLLPVADWTITGNHDPRSWTYEITNAGPSTTTTRKIAGEGVVHLRFSTDPRRPRMGCSPLQEARTSLKMLAYLEARLAGEMAGPIGHLLPMPNIGQNNMPVLRDRLNRLRGETVLFNSSPGSALRDNPLSTDYRPIRLGANPLLPVVQLHRQALIHVLTACGIPAEFVEAGDGTARREAWRQFVFGAVAPLARSVEAELTAKLENAHNAGFLRAEGQ